MLTILVILLVIAFISGSPLFTIMLAGTALGAFFSSRGFDIQFNGAINKLIGTSGRDEIGVLSTIPLFIYAGYVLAESKTADRLVRFANALLGWLPGGLAIVAIGTCALFTVFTGASGVTIIALGGVLMPALVRNGYPQKFSMGLIAGTGSVGLLFPPALPLFIYGTVYGLTGLDKEWETKRFLFAGVVPGLVLIGMLSAVAVFVAVKNNLPRQKFDAKELFDSFLRAVPELAIPFGVIVLLVSGVGELAEIAAITLLYVLILEVGIYRAITVKQVFRISHEALAMVGAIFAIILAATAFTDFMVNASVPRTLVEFTTSHVDSKVVFLLAINVILLIVGSVMDIFSAIVVVLPLVAPIAKQYGIDPYHLGVIFLLNLEVGYLHPPVGLNLFLTSVKFKRPITEVMWATVPFLVTMFVALLVVSYVPALTVVPEAERRSPVNNLVEIVHTGLEEIKVAYPTLEMIDDRGTVLLGEDGKPVVKKFAECAKIKDDMERTGCQQVFFDATDCRPDPKSVDPKQTECFRKAVASWVVGTLNSDPLHPENAVIVVKELALVSADGKAIELEKPVLDAQGNEVTDEDGDTKTEQKAIVGKDGKPMTKTIAGCDKLKGTTKEGCRQLFVEVSKCHIAPPDHAACITEKQAACTPAAPSPEGAAGSGSDAGSAVGSGGDAGSAVGSGSASPSPVDCGQLAVDTCRGDAVRACTAEAAKVWLEESDDRQKPE